MTSKVEVELPPQLVLPLPLEHGRADDEDAADSPSQQQFFQDQPAWIVLPRPTPSASSRLTRGMASARRTGSNW